MTYPIKRAAAVFVCSAATLVLAATAQAEGIYVSGKISGSTFGHTIERNTGGVVLPVPDTGGVSNVEETEFSGGVGIGYLKNFADNKLFAGIEGYYDVEYASTRNINGVLVTELDLNATYGVRGLLGVNATDKLSLYAHGGLAVLDFDIKNSYTFAPPVREASATESAFSYGFGASYKINHSISLFSEYTQITDVSFKAIPEVAGGTNRVNPNDVDLRKISLGLRYNF